MDFTETPPASGSIAWLHSMVYDPALVTEETDRGTLGAGHRPRDARQRPPDVQQGGVHRRRPGRRGSDPPPYWAMLHKVKAPTLITWGRDDRVSPLDMALIPMRTIPRAELHVFPDCGHWAMIEQKAAFESRGAGLPDPQGLMGSTRHASARRWALASSYPPEPNDSAGACRPTDCRN